MIIYSLEIQDFAMDGNALSNFDYENILIKKK